MASGSSTERRTQRERTEQTTQALIDAARRLFAREGYEATSLDVIASAAGVTKGALYHHFAGKRQVFRAVVEREDERVAEAITAASARKKQDSWQAFSAGARAFLDACLEPEAQRIMLLDGPAALGRDTVHEIEGETTFEVLSDGLRRAIRDGRIDKRPVEPLARMLFGAIREVATAAARAESDTAAARGARAELRRLLGALEA